MKKLIAILIFFSILFSYSYVLAANYQPGNYIKYNEQKAIKNEIQSLSRTINKNNARIQRLVVVSNKAYNKAKENVAELLAKKNELMQVEIRALKNAIKLLNEYNITLNNVNGDMESEFSKLEDAKNSGNLEQQKRIMQRIINLQISRINELRKSIKCMNGIAHM